MSQNIPKKLQRIGNAYFLFVYLKNVKQNIKIPNFWHIFIVYTSASLIPVNPFGKKKSTALSITLFNNRNP